MSEYTYNFKFNSHYVTVSGFQNGNRFSVKIDIDNQRITEYDARGLSPYLLEDYPWIRGAAKTSQLLKNAKEQVVADLKDLLKFYETEAKDLDNQEEDIKIYNDLVSLLESVLK